MSRLMLPDYVQENLRLARKEYKKYRALYLEKVTPGTIVEEMHIDYSNEVHVIWFMTHALDLFDKFIKALYTMYYNKNSEDPKGKEMFAQAINDVINCAKTMKSTIYKRDPNDSKNVLEQIEYHHTDQVRRIISGESIYFKLDGDHRKKCVMT